MAAPGRAAWGNGVVVHSVWGVELVYEIQAAVVDDFLHVSPGEACCCAVRHVAPLSGRWPIFGGGSLLRAWGRAAY